MEQSKLHNIFLTNQFTSAQLCCMPQPLSYSAAWRTAVLPSFNKIIFINYTLIMHSSMEHNAKARATLSCCYFCCCFLFIFSLRAGFPSSIKKSPICFCACVCVSYHIATVQRIERACHTLLTIATQSNLPASIRSNAGAHTYARTFSQLCTHLSSYFPRLFGVDRICQLATWSLVTLMTRTDCSEFAVVFVVVFFY